MPSPLLLLSLIFAALIYVVALGLNAKVIDELSRELRFDIAYNRYLRSGQSEYPYDAADDPVPRLRAIVATGALMLVCLAVLVVMIVVYLVVRQRAEQRVDAAQSDAVRIHSPAAYDDVRTALHKRSNVSKLFAAVFAALTVLLFVFGMAMYGVFARTFRFYVDYLPVSASAAFWAISVVVAGVVVIAACLLDVRECNMERDLFVAPDVGDKQAYASPASGAFVVPVVEQQPPPSVQVPLPAALPSPPTQQQQAPATAIPVATAAAPVAAPASPPYPSPISPYPAGTLFMAVSDGRGGTVMVPVQQQQPIAAAAAQPGPAAQ